MARSSHIISLEITEIHAFARQHFQLYLGWYTFFLTVNFAAIGWFTSVLLTGALKVSFPVLVVGLFFVTQLIFSYLATLEVKKYFEEAAQRSTTLMTILANESGHEVQPQSAIPVQVYSKIIGLICYTLISFVFFWIAFSLVAIWLVPLKV